ncbi:NUDIX hydrolase [Kineosporia sp. NBRC 101731]|uniref:NUDIX domain-containing protein n=1 Tax=Kineosporia sp. NBRC 101731 TaxID=3032199 RepID=UPI0024A12650|nr:NUDIX hydrolase [Kineosporia sp. NBRC 101731]GLY32397.1 NUDIX hydrolase [Kineosporia sp. NBRC 101731]
MSSPDELEDFLAPRPVLSHDLIHHGKVWDIVSEKVDLGEGGQVTRELMDHPGAVTVLALDESDRVLMIRQYRHPVQMELWELPAGLLDVPGENPVAAAARELLEEADLQASQWDLLAEWFNTPGGSNEALRVYLARGISEVPEADRYQRDEEELNMPTRWIPLDEARDAVLAGKIHNPGAVIGVLAAVASREGGWKSLRPADSPWPAHRHYR